MDNLNQENNFGQEPIQSLNQEKKPTIIVISIIGALFIVGAVLGFIYIKKSKLGNAPYGEVINKTYTKEEVLDSMNDNLVRIENPAIDQKVLNSLSGTPKKTTKTSNTIKK